MFLLPLALPLLGCSGDDDDDDDSDNTFETSDFDSEVARRWFDLLYSAIRTEGASPPVASRNIGYAGVTLYEAVVQGMLETHHSLGGQLNGLATLPEAPDADVHWPSAANAALAAVLEHLFAAASAPTLTAIGDLETDLADQFDADADSDVVDRSIAHGEAIAAAIIEWAERDGYTEWNNCAFTPPLGDGLWEPTPPGFANALQPCWGRLRTFALLFPAECAPLSHPPYSAEVGSAFYAEALEVYETVDNLTTEQLAIAVFWADNPGATGTPPGHWISILEQICERDELTLDVAAEGFAKVGIAVADSFLSCWKIKYFYNLLRPVTYIQDLAGPIADDTWTTAPGVGTPPFPEYTSGHSVQSGAAAGMLEDMFGPMSFVDDTHADIPLPARSFDSFLDAAEEAAISRLYGGIHFRAAIENGIDQGRCIASVIQANVRFAR